MSRSQIAYPCVVIHGNGPAYHAAMSPCLEVLRALLYLWHVNRMRQVGVGAHGDHEWLAP